MNSFTEAKEFDKLKIMKNTYKESIRRSPTLTKTPTKYMYRYCGSSHPQDNAQPMVRSAQNAVKLATSE